MNAVDYLDSSGLAVLVQTWRHQNELGHRFAIKPPATESARRIFSLAGFDKVFDVVESDSSPSS